MMLLAVDIGNTNTLVGLFESGKLVMKFRLSTRGSLTSDEGVLLMDQLLDHAGIDREAVDGVIVSSVVPEVTGSFRQGARDHFGIEPIMVGPELDLGLQVSYTVPEEVGADRIVDAVAAWERFKGPVIVVDFGTATTFDVITGDGRYVGGAICPGLMSGAAELSRRAARLPRVEVKVPDRAIGRNTLESMQSGIVFGAVGQVKEMVSRLSAEMGEEPKIVATGGLVDLIASQLGPIEIDKDLTLRGLNILYQRNRG
jgi:type III pantothenate kinase